MYYPKDFIETVEGLVFVVVEEGLEEGRVQCFLRYVKQPDGWRKYSTDEANRLLAAEFPDYHFYSRRKDAILHGVPPVNVSKHHQPMTRLRTILSIGAMGKVENDLVGLCRFYQGLGISMENIGVTGSVLLGAQTPGSDLDLVVYGRETFNQVRNATCQLIEAGQLMALDQTDWQSTYRRRDCTLTFDEYVWHESRKFNKAMINGRKVDLSMIENTAEQPSINYRKKGRIRINTIVRDDSFAFSYPAVFGLAHPDIDRCVSFTATFTGQARVGEQVEIAGLLEQAENGLQRIVVGSSREARGEYIKVLTDSG